MNQRETRKNIENVLNPPYPPSSPPITYLLIIRTAMHVNDVIRNKITEKDRSPAGT
jgi:hypothetical protein